MCSVVNATICQCLDDISHPIHIPIAHLATTGVLDSVSTDHIDYHMNCCVSVTSARRSCNRLCPGWSLSVCLSEHDYMKSFQAVSMKLRGLMDCYEN